LKERLSEARERRVSIPHPPQQILIMNFFSNKKTKPSVTAKELKAHVESLEQKIDELSQELADFKQGMKSAVCKVSIVRYNPFGDIGGDQSFSIAMLDDYDTGVVVTSHYGRDANRVYAKPVKEGKAEYELSQEENKALMQAIQNES